MAELGYSVTMPPTIEVKKPFQTDAGHVLSEYRTALLDLVHAAAGEGADLERSMGLDKTLAWKVTSATACAHPFDVARHIPGKSAIRIIIQAGKKQGVERALLTRVEEAYREYERLIATHAGDRATLEMMLLGYAEKERARADRDYRKAAFRANSYVFGIQAQTIFRTYIIHPSDSAPGMFDCISLRGHIGLRRIRAEAPWIVHRPRVTDDRGRHLPLRAPQALDAKVRAQDNPLAVPWMHDYCSQPLPDVQRVAGTQGRIHCEILNGPVGNTGITTCILGETIPGVGPTARCEGHSSVELVLRADMPVKRLILDQLVHRDLLEQAAPDLRIYSELNGPTPPGDDANLRHQLPTTEIPQRLGADVTSMHCADIPRYTDLLRDALKSQGLDPAKFIAYRSTIDYPPIPSAIVHRTRLPG
jgi:hypothetical protein